MTQTIRVGDAAAPLKQDYTVDYFARPKTIRVGDDAAPLKLGELDPVSRAAEPSASAKTRLH